jgi:prevent-host-death family protein
MLHVTLEEATRQLPELIEKAVEGGEEVVITRGSTPVVKLAPCGASRRRRQFGSAKGLIEMGPDFDDPLEDFAEYQ